MTTYEWETVWIVVVPWLCLGVFGFRSYQAFAAKRPGVGITLAIVALFLSPFFVVNLGPGPATTAVYAIAVLVGLVASVWLFLAPNEAKGEKPNKEAADRLMQDLKAEKEKAIQRMQETEQARTGGKA